MLKNNNIDVNKYNSDKVYKIIKKFKIPYNTLTKDSIFNLIINFDKNSKNGKIENPNFMLKQKTPRKKSIRDNVYSEKIKTRKNSISKLKNFKKESITKIKDENYINLNNLYSVKIKTKLGRQIKSLKANGN